MGKRRFIDEKSWKIGVFRQKHLTLFGGYGKYEGQSVFADGKQM
ncbi:hypothetical protein [Anaerotignum sp. MB30-C6]|nr:hypothetical protein [Anaerotignum sp. MB30-C6]WMI81313.1 hypothetical protein RBQ60_00860 [Anaerotignum sp. MB30-C6]